MSLINSFTQLFAWQKAHGLALQVYHLTRDFPKDERFGLTNQIRRAAVSVSANIAEGFKRHGHLEQRRFYNIAASSLEELRAELILAKDLGYFPKDYTVDIFDLLDQASCYLASWIRKH